MKRSSCLLAAICAACSSELSLPTEAAPAGDASVPNVAGRSGAAGAAVGVAYGGGPAGARGGAPGARGGESGSAGTSGAAGSAVGMNAAGASVAGMSSAGTNGAGTSSGGTSTGGTSSGGTSTGGTSGAGTTNGGATTGGGGSSVAGGGGAGTNGAGTFGYYDGTITEVMPQPFLAPFPQPAIGTTFRLDLGSAGAPDATIWTKGVRLPATATWSQDSVTLDVAPGDVVWAPGPWESSTPRFWRPFSLTVPLAGGSVSTTVTGDAGGSDPEQDCHDQLAVYTATFAATLGPDVTPPSTTVWTRGAAGPRLPWELHVEFSEGVDASTPIVSVSDGTSPVSIAWTPYGSPASTSRLDGFVLDWQTHGPTLDVAVGAFADPSGNVSALISSTAASLDLGPPMAVHSLDSCPPAAAIWGASCVADATCDAGAGCIALLSPSQNGMVAAQRVGIAGRLASPGMTRVRTRRACSGFGTKITLAVATRDRVLFQPLTCDGTWGDDVVDLPLAADDVGFAIFADPMTTCSWVLSLSRVAAE